MIKELLKRPIGVTMSVIAIVVLSIVAMGYLPVSLMPDIDIPQITIQVSAPGLSVREVDNTLLKPLKNQLSQVAGLKNITAEARADAGAIYMDFEPNGNIDLIFIEVNEKLDRAVTTLPKDVERPKVIKASVTDIPAFYLNLSLKSGAPREPGKPREAGIDFSELGQFARDVIAKRIEQLPQTAMVDISGVVTPELLCIPDYTKLTSMGVGIGLLENAIADNNVSLGALSIKDGQYRYSIHFDSRIISKEDIENIYINHDGRIYRFKELCEIVERPAKRNGLVRSGADPAVTLAIIKQSDARMADLQESIAALITDLEKEHRSYGYVPDQKFGLLRIKKGATEFDPDYCFNMTDMNVEGVQGGKLQYSISNFYAGNGELYVLAYCPAFASASPDYINEKTNYCLKADLYHCTMKALNLPRTNGYSCAINKYGDDILFGLATEQNGTGIFTYNRKTDRSIYP